MKKLITLALLLVSNVALANCALEIEGNDAMQFNKKELKVSSSCKSVTLTLKHVGKLPGNVMGHNWVLTKAADKDPVANAGMAAGAGNNYVPQGDARVLAATKVIGGGEQTKVEIDMSKLKKGQDYAFFCSFPGHWALMKGKFIVE